MELISVIIPVYNGEKTIKETIESVINQTHSNLEIIVINSDSQDATVEIVDNIEDPRIKIYNYPQGTASINRNRGINHALGKFIAFLDADDIWKPDKLELQYKALLENPQAAIAYSWTDAIDENGKFLRSCSHANYQGNVYKNLLLDDFIGSGSNVMVRSCTFAEVGNFNETLTNAEDTDMWLRLSRKYDFIVIKKVQVLYRISNSSKSANIRGAEISNLQIIEESFANADSGLQYIKPYRIANLYKYLSYKSLSSVPGQQNSLQIARILWKTILTDPNLMTKRVIYKAILKFMIMIFLPSPIATLLINRFPKLFDVSTFFGYTIANPKLIKS